MLLMILLVTSSDKESQHTVELSIFRAWRNTLYSLYSYIFVACIQTCRGSSGERNGQNTDFSIL